MNCKHGVKSMSLYPDNIRKGNTSFLTSKLKCLKAYGNEFEDCTCETRGILEADDEEFAIDILSFS